MNKIAVFASGFGSNFQAIIESINQKRLNAKIEVLVSDNPKSLAIERAKTNLIDVFAFNPKTYTSKVAYEIEILNVLIEKKVDLIVLAGYMRIIGETLLNQFPNRIINIHPSLLPKYKGKDAIGQAFNAKESIIGVTVHYVNKDLDSGKIIMQESINISNLKLKEEIEFKIHELEHIIYPKSIKKVLEELNEKSLN